VGEFEILEFLNFETVEEAEELDKWQG